MEFLECHFSFEFEFVYVRARICFSFYNIAKITMKQVNILAFSPAIIDTFTYLEAATSGCSVRKGVLRSFAKFTGKHLCQSLGFNKVAGLKLLRIKVLRHERVKKYAKQVCLMRLP